MTAPADWRGPGPAEAPTLVAIAPGDAAGLLAAAAAAAGCGLLAWEPPPAGQDPVAVLPGVLADHRFRRGILVGVGEGAAIAARYAGGVEDLRIRGLVLIAPRGFGEAPGPPTGAAREALEAIGYLRVPIRLIRGAFDPRFGPDRAAAIADEAYCPVDDVVIPVAGAAPHRDAPEAVSAAVAEFADTLLVTFGERSGRHG